MPLKLFKAVQLLFPGPLANPLIFCRLTGQLTVLPYWQEAIARLLKPTIYQEPGCQDLFLLLQISEKVIE